MFELFLLNHLLKNSKDSKQVMTLCEYRYEDGVEGQVFLKSCSKPKWQDDSVTYDMLTIHVAQSHYMIQAFRCPQKPGICFLQIECPKDRYHTLTDSQRLSMAKTQDALQSHDLFAPVINAGHFIQIQIPINEAKHLLMQGLRQDFSKIFPESTTGILIAFDILFFFLFNYTFFNKPEQQVIHLVQLSIPECEKIKRIHEVLSVVGVPPVILFKKVVAYATEHKIDLPLWLIELLYQDPELLKDPEILEIGYQSLVAILSSKKLKKLPLTELEFITKKAVETIHTYHMQDHQGVVAQLLCEIARRLGGVSILPQISPHIHMNADALLLFLQILQGFSHKPEPKPKPKRKNSSKSCKRQCV